jgi:hypothetical protein
VRTFVGDMERPSQALAWQAIAVPLLRDANHARTQECQAQVRQVCRDLYALHEHCSCSKGTQVLLEQDRAPCSL